MGKDFSTADKGKTFKRGGDMATKKMNPFAKFEKSGKDVEMKGKGKEGSKKEEAFDKTQMMGGMKKGGGVKKMAAGGYTSAADGVASKGKTKGTQIVMSGNKGMKKGGMC